MTLQLGLVAAAVAALLAAVLLPPFIVAGHRWGALDKPGAHKRHKRPVPYLGGTVLFIVVWVTLAGLRWWTDAPLDSHSGAMPTIFIGATVIFLLGLFDDIRPLPAWSKLVIQIGVGAILYAGGLGVELLIWPTGEIETGVLALPITIAWVVLLTNAINLIDGLDGLAAGVSFIAGVSIVTVAYLRMDSSSEIALIWVMLGYLAVFWWHNRYPARIFLGDSGSLQIGYYFAAFTLMANFKSFAASALYVPLLALGVPIIEAVSSLLRRLFTGRSVMQADHRHLFHYLSLAGLSRRQVLWTFYGLSVVFGFFAVAMDYWNRMLVVGFLIGFMVVVMSSFLFIVLRLPEKLRRVRQNGRSRVEEDS